MARDTFCRPFFSIKSNNILFWKAKILSFCFWLLKRKKCSCCDKNLLTNECSIVYTEIPSQRDYNWIWCPRRGIVRYKSAIPPVISFEKTVTRHREFLYCLRWSWADTNSMVFWINSKPLCMSIWFEARAKRSRRRLVLIHNGFLFFSDYLAEIWMWHITSVALWKLNTRYRM